LNNKIGLLAGKGTLPHVFLKQAKKKNLEVVIFTISGEADKSIERYGYRIYALKITQLGGILKILKKEAIKNLIMLGYVRHTNLLKKIKFDFKSLLVLLRAKDLRAASLIREIIREFEKNGIKIMPSTYLMEDSIAKSGPCTRSRPSGKEMKNIKFGFSIARKIASLDIGQTVIVKNGIIVAVEAQEGTDECIIRGAKIAGKDFIAVKTARKSQDLRYDIPTIGETTVSLVKKYGGKGIAVEAGKTFLIEKEKLINFADKEKVFIYGAEE
jgi:DUF1009 family protein